MEPQIGAVVLAAGKGTRMKSARAKVLHEVFFKPMLHHVLDVVVQTEVSSCAVIVGHQRQAVAESLTEYAVHLVHQEEQLGTGHAVLCAEPVCRVMEHILILCGDTPLIQAETLRAFIGQHLRSKSDLTLMATVMDNPFGYGRILTNDAGHILAIVEEKDASESQRQIQNINAGIYLVRRDFLFHALRQIRTDNSQGELYLTDIVSIARREKKIVCGFAHPCSLDVLGVNSRVELAQAESVLQQRRNLNLMRNGVSMLSPESTRVAPDCHIGQDTLLQGNVTICQGSLIGAGCHIAQGAVLSQCTLGDGVQIGANAVLHGCRIAQKTTVPPLAREL